MKWNTSSPFRRMPIVKAGDKVKAGELLTDGSADIAEIFKFGSKEMVEEYIIREINKVYELQSASISRKHTEIIIRQMFSPPPHQGFRRDELLRGRHRGEYRVHRGEHARGCREPQRGQGRDHRAWHHRSVSPHQELALRRFIPEHQPRPSSRTPSRAAWTLSAASRKTSSSAD